MIQFFGKYRGKVEDNRDPLMQGRVRPSVPSIYGSESLNWAMPCVPYAGSGLGFFVIPPVGANVWIEFEGGDPDKPIWTGCFWGEQQTPADLGNPDQKVFKTNTFTLKIVEGLGIPSVTIETTAGMKLVMSSNSLELSNGAAKIMLTGPQVSVNDGALEVT